MAHVWQCGDTFELSESGAQQNPDLNNHLFFIISYAEEYPENWKKIEKAMEERSHVRGLQEKGEKS